MYLVTSLGTFDNLSEFVEAMRQRSSKKQQTCNHCHLTRYVEASGFCRFCEIDLWERLGVNVKED